MKNSFTNKQTNLDLNGPYLSFDTEPQSVTGIGTTVGGTTGATVTLTGISTAGFLLAGTMQESHSTVSEQIAQTCRYGSCSRTCNLTSNHQPL